MSVDGRSVRAHQQAAGARKTLAKADEKRGRTSRRRRLGEVVAG